MRSASKFAGHAAKKIQLLKNRRKVLSPFRGPVDFLARRPNITGVMLTASLSIVRFSHAGRLVEGSAPRA
jgi:hypothetical protein